MPVRIAQVEVALAPRWQLASWRGRIISSSFGLRLSSDGIAKAFAGTGDPSQRTAPTVLPSLKKSKN
jgi:hypothetical protein